MYKDKFCLLLFMCCFFGFSQVKKVSDTVYIYEEVIVYDTIYVEKPFDKIKIDKVIISPENKESKPQITIFQKDKKTKIEVDTLIIESNKKSFSLDYGLKFLAGISSNSLFKEFNAKPQLNFGIGIFVRKTLFHPNFSIGTGFETSYSMGNSSLSSQNNSSLNGFYFTDDRSLKLFNSITNKGFQFQVPLQIYWKIKKFTPSIGVFGNLSNYKSTFIGSSRNLPLALDETQTYTAKAFYFGYLAQLDYLFSDKWSVGLNYSLANSKKLSFSRNSDDSFAVSRSIRQSCFGVSLAYHF